MKRFKIGEDVVALTNPPTERCQPRVKGKVYKVLDVCYCSKCGVQKINIAGKTTTKTGMVYCACGYKHPDNGLWWTHSELFASPSELQAELEALEREEKYEECAELVKIMAMIETA